MLEIHDRRAMNPQENLGIQFGLEIRHGIAQHMGLLARADSHIIFFRANPADIRNRQKENSSLGSATSTGLALALVACNKQSITENDIK